MQNRSPEINFISIIFINSGARIGFSLLIYNVSEGDGTVNVSYRVLDGELGFDVDVNFFTSNGSAIGKYELYHISSESS